MQTQLLREGWKGEGAEERGPWRRDEEKSGNEVVGERRASVSDTGRSHLSEQRLPGRSKEADHGAGTHRDVSPVLPV